MEPSFEIDDTGFEILDNVCRLCSQELDCCECDIDDDEDDGGG